MSLDTTGYQMDNFQHLCVVKLYCSLKINQKESWNGCNYKKPILPNST